LSGVFGSQEKEEKETPPMSMSFSEDEKSGIERMFSDSDDTYSPFDVPDYQDTDQQGPNSY
jgi:hypothetical protein